MRRLLLCLVALASSACSERGDAPPATAPARDREVAAAAAQPTDHAAAATAPADVVETVEADRWYVGTMNNAPSASMHSVVLRRPDGTRRTQEDVAIIIQRSLGAQSIRIEMRQQVEFIEDAQGEITGFRFDEDQNGERTAASGHVDGDAVVATVHHLDRSDTRRVPIPAGRKLLGQKASQERLTDHELQPGEQEVFVAPQLMSGQVVMVTSTATFKQREENGDLAFDVVPDVMPIPMRMVLDPQGELRRMKLDMGFFSIEFLPSDGPVALLPAELASAGLVAAKGPAPTAAPENRYRLPADALAALPDDPFQRRDGEVLVVAVKPDPTPPADPADLLKAEPQLELDDAAMRAWVEGVVAEAKSGGAADDAAICEQLRLAVRGRIVHKDLAKADGSALETFREQRGDCTEHANLLCAALRIAGFPARVDVGIVYAADFGGWVGHAWNAAWIGDRWLHLDSAYPGQARSQYIKLGTGSGRDQPSTTAQLVTALARLMGSSVETVAPR